MPERFKVVCIPCKALYKCSALLLQPIKLSDAQVLPTSWLGGSMRGLQPGGHVHKEAVHLLSLQSASITSSGTFKPGCYDLSQFREFNLWNSLQPVVHDLSLILTHFHALLKTVSFYRAHETLQCPLHYHSSSVTV